MPRLPALPILLGAIAVFTWPWLPRFWRATPGGSEPSTLTHFHLALVEWARLAAREGRSWWDPPFFDPFPGVLAWSEPQPLLAAASLLCAPFLEALPTYNLILLIWLLLSGWTSAAIARELGADRGSALLAGVWMAAGPQIVQQLGAPHLVSQGFAGLCALGLLRLHRSSQPRHIWMAALGGLCTALSNAQGLVLMLACLPPLALPFLPRLLRRWPHSLAALALCAALFAPFALPHLRLLSEVGHQRELAEVQGVLHLRDLFTPADGHWLGRRLGMSYDQGWYSWDMGLLLVPLGLASLLLLPRRPDRRGLALGAHALAGLLLGFGPALQLQVGGVELAPYAWLFERLPGLSGLRSPAHGAFIPALGFAVFGAVGLSRLRGRWPGLPWLPLATLLLGAEMWALPQRIWEPQAETSASEELIRAIDQLPPGSRGLELPMSRGDLPSDYIGEVEAIRRAMRHGQPVANGYSGYFPTAYFQLRLAWLEDPTGRALRYTEALGLDWLWLRPAALPLSSALEARLGPPALRRGAERLFRLSGHSPRRIPAPAQARLRRKPNSGDLIGLRLPAALAEAALVELRPPLQLTLQIDEGSGWTGQLVVSGAALVDVGATRLFVRITEPPRPDGPGRGRLVSGEEAERLGARRP